MNLTNEERDILVRREIEKAKSFFSQAEANMKMGLWDVVANRLYYAMFHAVSALLIKDGRKVGTHKGVVSSFGQYYVRTGIFPPDAGRLYSQLQSIREKADYSCLWEAQETDVMPKMGTARKLLEDIERKIAL